MQRAAPTPHRSAMHGRRGHPQSRPPICPPALPRRATIRAALVVCVVIFAALVCGGCVTANAEQPLHVEMQALQARVDELELTNRRLHARLQQHDQTLQLVDDQLRSLRLAISPQQAGPQPKTIRFSEPPPAPPEPLDEPLSSDHVSITWDDTSPLPSETTPHAFSPAPSDAEEIIVTDESVRAYMGAHAATSSATSSAAAPSGPRIPKAPVVHGDQLDVMPTDKQGRVIAAAAPQEPEPRHVSPATQDPIQTYRDALDAYRATQYSAAIQGFTAFLANNPPPDYVDNALYWLGDSYYGLGDYAQAATYFHRVVKEFPNENKVPDALLKVGLTYQRLNKEPAAQEIFLYLTDTYPKSEAARLAREKISPSDG